jgi:hypothetical protein
VEEGRREIVRVPFSLPDDVVVDDDDSLLERVVRMLVEAAAAVAARVGMTASKKKQK